MKPIGFFGHDVRVFWATTYELDLKLWDQFLLRRRLPQQPLNAVVLCDETSLDDDLSRVSDLDKHVVATANKRYVLRGVRVPSGGRFHPKTYLFAGRGTTLLVGSGNLTRSGLDRGREVFTQFDAQDSDGAHAIRSWLSWIGRLVASRDDPVLQGRYELLREALASVTPGRPAAERGFCVNEDTSILQQLTERGGGPVAEVHVTAPFYDRNAGALRDLCLALRPSRELHVYIGSRTSVDRARLAQVLADASCRTFVHQFEPPGFVHAKLVGAVAEDGEGVLLVGSANLAHAALTLTYQQRGAGANCEAAVLAGARADEIRAAFRPPDTEVPVVDLASLSDVEFRDDETMGSARPLRLLNAWLTDARHVQTKLEPADPEDVYLAWDELRERIPLAATGVTAEPLPEDADALIVWICSADGAPLSNRVVLDDRAALDAVLGEKAASQARPAELADESEGSQLVDLLSWAHRRFIFDLEDTNALRRARDTDGGGIEGGVEDSAFWERYAREELTYDTRSQTYRPVGSSTALGVDDMLLREIEAMLHAAPHERRLRLVRSSSGPEDEPEPGTGHPWSAGAKQRLRARNLLRRWARALSDPRHAWLAPDATAVNYTALIDVLCLIWLGGALDGEVITELLGEAWVSLLGSEGKKGLLERVEEDEARIIVQSIKSDTRELASGLAAAALAANREWKTFIYDWQPFLVKGLSLSVFSFGDFAVDVASSLGADVASPSDVEALLRSRSTYVDDEEWGKRMTREFGFRRVAIIPHASFKGVDVAVSISGIDDPAHDNRLVAIARRALMFKGASNVLLDVDGERYLIRLGVPLMARIDGDTRRGQVPIDGRCNLRTARDRGVTCQRPRRGGRCCTRAALIDV
jgi:hypothetical protein